MIMYRFTVRDLLEITLKFKQILNSEHNLNHRSVPTIAVQCYSRGLYDLFPSADNFSPVNMDDPVDDVLDVESTAT